MEKINNSKKMLAINYIIVLVGVLFDQYTKKLIEALKGQPDIDVVHGIFSFTYVENRGAAFGMMKGQRLFFLAIAVVVFLVVSYVFVKIPNDKKYIKLNVVLAFILSGAIGNMIDRFALGYVRDFIYFYCINFAVFNVADIYITCATALLVILVLFVFKDEDFAFMKKEAIAEKSMKTDDTNDTKEAGK